MAENQAPLRLMHANLDILTGRLLASFGGADGDMVTVNIAMIATGDDPAAAIRARLVEILRVTADALETPPEPQPGA